MLLCDLLALRVDGIFFCLNLFLGLIVVASRLFCFDGDLLCLLWYVIVVVRCVCCFAYFNLQYVLLVWLFAGLLLL